MIKMKRHFLHARKFCVAGRRQKYGPGGPPVTPEHERLFKLESATLPALEAKLAAIKSRFAAAH